LFRQGSRQILVSLSFAYEVGCGWFADIRQPRAERLEHADRGLSETKVGEVRRNPIPKLKPVGSLAFYSDYQEFVASGAVSPNSARAVPRGLLPAPRAIGLLPYK
jgi:hypothetical protein